jgi:hypothetical protein
MDVFEASAAQLPAQAQTPEQVTRFVFDVAVHAPSVHNTQPSWFSYGDLGITMHADSDRKLRVADPGGREMMISCGAALLTARVALRRLGYVPEVTVLPDPDMPNLVARISWDRQVPPSEFERQLFAEVERRHTHRGGFSAAVLPAGLLDALRAEAARENARLRIVADGAQQSALAGVVEAGDYVVRTDETRAREQAHWAPPPGSSRRDGVPPTAYRLPPSRARRLRGIDYQLRSYAAALPGGSAAYRICASVPHMWLGTAALARLSSLSDQAGTRQGSLVRRDRGSLVRRDRAVGHYRPAPA